MNEVLVQVGERLKAARLEKGSTMEEASRATRISKRHLQSMEEGNFGKLPTDASIRGFTRLYAEFLELNTSPFYADFLKALTPPPGTGESPPKPVPLWYAIFAGGARRGR